MKREWSGQWAGTERQRLKLEVTAPYSESRANSMKRKMKKALGPFSKISVFPLSIFLILFFTVGQDMLAAVGCENASLFFGEGSSSWVVTIFAIVFLVNVMKNISFVKQLWKPAQSLLSKIGLAETDTHYEEVEVQYKTPTHLVFEEDPEPVFRWRFVQNESLGEVLDPPGPGMSPNPFAYELPEDGELVLAPRQCAVELSVDPQDPQLLCLELRSVKTGARLHVALSPDDFGEGFKDDELPRIERQGIALSVEDRASLLATVTEFSALQGVTLPVAVEEAVSMKA